jgi:TolB-like protein
VAAGWLGGRFVHGGASGRGASVSAEALPSVAVLPFRDLGTNADSVHFADGVQDDILTQLGRIESLRVTSRTSTEKYRDTDKDIPDIATELNVRAVLEGGVQRTPDRVHINMQLIDGATDKHLWAETYDRELNADNVFAIQSEIARAVADALKATLTPDEERSLAEVPTHDLEALDLYHRGRRLLDVDNADDQRAAILLLQEAVRRDPTFARAWAELTRALSWQVREGFENDTMPARRALARTRALDPGSDEAALAEGNYLYYARGDYPGALAAFRKLTGARVKSADVSFSTANVLRRLGRWQEAVDLYEETTRLEPENPRGWFDLGATYRYQRRYDDALSAFERASQVAPEMASAMGAQADLLIWSLGDTVRARALLPRLRGLPGDDYAGFTEADLSYVQRDPRALDQAAGLRSPGFSFDSYDLHPDGSPTLWRACMAWALGHPDLAGDLASGLEDELLEDDPALAQGGPPVEEGTDLFGIKASLHAVRGWMAAFAGDRARALAEADSAVAIFPPEVDATSGVPPLRQRARIRIVVGDLEGAVADLRRLLELPGWTTVTELRMDPFYDSLRDRPDFQALLAGT